MNLYKKLHSPTSKVYGLQGGYVLFLQAKVLSMLRWGYSWSSILFSNQLLSKQTRPFVNLGQNGHYLVSYSNGPFKSCNKTSLTEESKTNYNQVATSIALNSV